MPLVDLKDSSKKYYDASKIKTALTKYDLIIFTPEGVYDTSKYNMSHSTTGIEFNASVIVTGEGNSLELVYNPSTSSTAIQSGKLNKTCRAVQIPERTIEKVILKNKRNFLGNRVPNEEIAK